jgi:hypothetical protein
MVFESQKNKTNKQKGFETAMETVTETHTTRKNPPDKLEQAPGTRKEDLVVVSAPQLGKERIEQRPT